MQFLIIAADYKDLDAPGRRQLARTKHLELGDEMFRRGELLYAAAILDNNSQMIGSMMVVEFPSRGDLDRWLEIEPYVTEKVWDHIEIKLCKSGPRFSKLPTDQLRKSQ
jgi:uncharacterized protein